MRGFKFFFYCYLFLRLTSPLFAQDAKLIAEAKKEGKVVVYGSMEQDIFEGIQKSFEKKMGFALDYWRASGAAVLERVITERKAGKPFFDVVINNAGPMEIMLKDGAFTPYNSPLAKNFAAELIHPQLGPSYRTSVVGIIYNKSIISPDKAPKTLEDVVKPEYRGKLVMPHPINHTLTTQWLASLDRIMPKARAEKFIRDLAAAKPIFVESIVPAADRVGTGETPVGITFVRFVLTYNKQGASLDYVRDYNMLGDGQYITLGAKPPRPNAGKAFIDFFLDEESMKIQADTGEFVNRKGISPPLADANKIKFVQMYQFEKKDFEEKQKEYQKIFLQ